MPYVTVKDAVDTTKLPDLRKKFPLDKWDEKVHQSYDNVGDENRR